jgi:hypothetical protein
MEIRPTAGTPNYLVTGQGGLSWDLDHVNQGRNRECNGMGTAGNASR